MQSDGGLAPTNRFSGHRAVLSGPAGGYVGYALTTKWHGYDAEKLQLIGFDMGGTSTDVSRFAGSYEHVFEATLAGQLPLHTHFLTAQTHLLLLFVTCDSAHMGNIVPMSSICMRDFCCRLQHILVTHHVCCCNHQTATGLLCAVSSGIICAT